MRLPVTIDIADAQQVQALIGKTLDRYGRIDVFVNNGGIGLNRPFLETTYEEWTNVINVLLTGTFLCARAAARVMAGQGYGSIANVASISGQRGAQGRAAYGSANAGVIQLTRVMVVELASHGIRVNAISPGPVDTEQCRATHTAATRSFHLRQIPVRRYGQREEIAAAAMFLASDEASYVPGHILNVDGGFFAAGLVFAPNEP